MVFVLYLVIGLGVVAFVWGGAWILKIAFGVSTGWGLVCLFFFPVFLTRHWEECRLPFFINIAGLLVFLVGMMGLAGYTENAKVKDLARVEWEDVDPVANSGPVVDPWWDKNQRGTESVESSDSMGSTEIEGAPGIAEESASAVTSTDLTDLTTESADTTPAPLPHWQRKWGREVKQDEYQSMIGSLVKVFTADGQTFKVMLVAVGDSEIQVRQRVGTGSMMFSLDHETVIEVRVKD